MRLDRYLSASGLLSRREAAVAARAGRVLLNGAPVRRVDMHIDEEHDRVTLDGTDISYRQYEYVRFWIPKFHKNRFLKKYPSVRIPWLPSQKAFAALPLP